MLRNSFPCVRVLNFKVTNIKKKKKSPTLNFKVNKNQVLNFKIKKRQAIDFKVKRNLLSHAPCNGLAKKTAASAMAAMASTLFGSGWAIAWALSCSQCMRGRPVTNKVQRPRQAIGNHEL